MSTLSHPYDVFNPSLLDGADIRRAPHLEEFLLHVNAERPAERELAAKALGEVLQSDDMAQPAMLGALLMGAVRIANPDTVAGFVDAVGAFEGKSLVDDKIELKKPTDDTRIVGCAGSGKKGRKTINITTPAMVIATAAGAKVVKAGSRSASSVTGSTDILESVGYQLPASTQASTDVFDETGFGFYSIEDTIPKFDRIYGNRFFSPHALSFALPGTLIPVRSDVLMYGLAGPNVSLSAHSFKALGYNSVLVCSNTQDGLRYVDEMVTQGGTSVAGVDKGVVGNTRTFDAANYVGIREQTGPTIDSLHDSAGHSELFVDILRGRHPNSVAENTICLNAATILYLGNVAADPVEGFDIARQTVRSGHASQQLNDLVNASHDC